MRSFLEEVVQEVYEKNHSFEDVVFILPNKRAGAFLRGYISGLIAKTIFSPQIYSIEEFVSKIAGIGFATHTEQLFLLYHTYIKNNPEEPDSFNDFCKWASTILADFTEIDRHLIEPGDIFSYLSDIQEINHWMLTPEKSPIVDRYIRFWATLKELHNGFNQSLLKRKIGHQGLVYKEATVRLGHYLKEHSSHRHVFVGFNALNAAEKLIIEEVLKSTQNTMYWDIDPYFLQDNIHDAGFFIRKYVKDWSTFQNVGNMPKKSIYLTKKNIQIIGVPKNVSQAKYVGNILNDLVGNTTCALEKTAVVLGDENLLNPLLNAIPKQIDHVNITMGYPLRNTVLASLFSELITLNKDRSDRGWPHNIVLRLLAHPIIKILHGTRTGSSSLTDSIVSGNWIYVTYAQIQEHVARENKWLDMLFLKENPTPSKFLTQCLDLIHLLKRKLTNPKYALEIEQLYRFHLLFQSLQEMVHVHTFISDLKSVESLYNELLANETLDFKGEPLRGLQIMGMLESRNLDFETVIITSVNEGILPSGKSNNSFIPFDLKRSYGLPTYKEKDAVYTYHFYRLLQRAKNIFILYNTEPEVLEGREKSRLIHQLLTDENILGNITEIIATPAIHPSIKPLETIAKDKALLQAIENAAKRGFSPTSLSNYIRNPLEFYKRNILKIEDTLEVEKSVAYNTFGTILHDSLDTLYRPFIGQLLGPIGLKAIQKDIKPVVMDHFIKFYDEEGFKSGKNLIAYNVIVRYIENFIALEMAQIKNNTIKIVALEQFLSITLDIPEIGYPVVLHGKLDRVDRVDGRLRIIDYKTGAVAQNQLEIVDWGDLISNHNQNKAFQLLCYGLLYHRSVLEEALQAGIISFKNLKGSPLLFAIKSTKSSKEKDQNINTKTIDTFYDTLKTLLLEICNPEIPFIEKEVL